MFTRLTIFWKLSLLLLLAIGGLGVSSYINLGETKDLMVETRKEELKNLIRSSLGIMQHYHREMSRGEFDEATAKKMAFDTIRGLRFGNNDYFFVFDTKGINYVLGPRPAAEGTNMNEDKDADGVVYVAELIKAAQKGGDYVSYQFPKPGENTASPKLGYAELFAPWDLLIGTGVYVDDIETAFAHKRNESIINILIILSIVGACGAAIGRSIAKPIQIITGDMNRLAKGDKGIEVRFTELTNEIGALARALLTFKENAIKVDRLQAEQKAAEERQAQERKRLMNEMADKFEQSVKGIVSTVSAAATEMQSSAKTLSGTAEETTRQAAVVAGASESAAQGVQTVASAAEELNASIGEITGQTNQTVQVARECVSEAEKTSAEVQELSKAAEDIESVVNLIEDIANQVNLLALNATIEAARAGEAGKGFAVVANEVKNLATQTGNATKEIASQITNIQEKTRHAVESISTISSTIKKVDEISTTVAAAAEEQGAATQEISRSVQKTSQDTDSVSQNIVGVKKAAEETSIASTQMLDTAGQLAKESEQLRAAVDQFINHIREA